ncbi:hypothetical protein GTA28_26215 [Rhodococcus hoagii]|uniref:hypothetical protein n=1 Tax=Rhodococcus hoagii TaxID=43767 RepID=UPI0019D90C6D|nr:hypothetical protein [Prescottella equi]NKZ80224.1 hypothetical protein [Prescottella equi]
MRASVKELGSVGATVTLAAVAGFLAPNYAAVIVACILGATLVVFSYMRPRIALVLWLTIVVVVPNWTTIYVVGIGMPPSSAVGIPVLAGVAAARIAGPDKLRISWMDWSLAVASLIVTLLWIGGELQGIYFVRDLLLVWVLAYILGRNADEMVKSAFAVLMAIAAVWGILEFMFGVHLFVDWMPSATHTLNHIQSRAGVDRSEAAFGHAIAYGASLAMAIPFAQNLRKHSLTVQLLLAAGIIVSLSRGPLIALAVTLVLLTWVTASSSKLRVRYIALTVVGASAVWVVLDRMYSGVYAEEVVSSGDSRSSQWEVIQPALRWFSSALTYFGPDATAEVRGIAIIDSTPLRLAANYGIVAAVLFSIPVVVAAWRVFRREAGSASIALAGQIPVLAVTSFITQWQALVFFVMGLVVTESMARVKGPARSLTIERRDTEVDV